MIVLCDLNLSSIVFLNYFRTLSQSICSVNGGILHNIKDRGPSLDTVLLCSKITSPEVYFMFNGKVVKYNWNVQGIFIFLRYCKG